MGTFTNKPIAAEAVLYYTCVLAGERDERGDGGNNLFNLTTTAVLRHKKWMMAPFGGAYLSSPIKKRRLIVVVR